jgi:mono/diheme cytochrome c family protein
MRWKPVAITLGALGMAGALAAGVVVLGGLYDVAATTQHTRPVYAVLELAMQRNVRRQARDLAPPPQHDAEPALRRGAACYRDHCVQCHGGPGVSRGAAGLGMQPLPSPLIDASRHWQLRELYWITRHGIKMSGMPAWQYRLADDELWAVSAFVAALARWTPQEYARRIGEAAAQQCTADAPEPATSVAPSAERGRVALYQYACNACHVIPGVTGSKVQVGPPLDGMARRRLIAGRLANTPDNMTRWLRDPHSVDPHTAMPDAGVGEADARDIAAYLATLD